MTKQEAVKTLLALCQAKSVDTDKYDWIRFVGSTGARLSIRRYYLPPQCSKWEWRFDGDLPDGMAAYPWAPTAQITITLKWGELTRDILEAARS